MLRLRYLFRAKKANDELDEELQYHLDRELEAGVERGLSPDEARYAALRALGAITQNKEHCRDLRMGNWVADLAQDMRYGLRTLRKNPGFSLLAVLALALGIGANTAMFSVAYGILFRPLPYADADRLAAVYLNYDARDNVFGTMCIRDYLTWKQNTRTFQEPALFRTQRLDILGKSGVSEQVPGAYVTANFFSTLGVAPLLGRTLAPGEDAPGSNSLAVLSESAWRKHFAAAPGVLGQTILVNGVPSTIIGVMPRAFQLPRAETEVWTNLILNPPTRFGPWFYRGVARLKPGVTIEQARADMNEIGLRLVQQHPTYKGIRMPVLSLREALVGAAVKPAVAVLTGAVGLVLLIALVNVANLMLARATVRQREIALRLSLGAGRGRVVRQLLTESTVLALIGGTAGLAVAWAGVALMRAWNPGNLPLIDAVRLDWTALAFTGLVSVLSGIVFGLAPAVETAKADLNDTLKQGARGRSPSRVQGRVRAALVVAQIAVSLMLLVGAGLLIRSFVNLQHVSAGFSAPAESILTMTVSPSDPKYNDSQAAAAFYQELLRRVSNIPGIESAAVGDSLPPDRQGDADSFQIEGQTLGPGEMNPVVSAVTVSPDFFSALGIPLVRGRYFTEHDVRDSTPVAIVSEGFARRFLPGQDAIGKRIRQRPEWMQIVGVVGNVKYMGLTTDTDSAYYMPFAQASGRRMYLVVRSEGEAARLADDVRRAIQAVGSGVTSSQVGTIEQALESTLSRPRFNTGLLTLFSAIAVLLAAIGIYALMAYSVAQRTHEIGVRMALGADRSDVLRMVVRQGLSLAAVGVAAGVGGALALTRLLDSMLFGIGAADVLTFAAAPAATVVVVLAATLVPALRATLISPVIALRYE